MRFRSWIFTWLAAICLAAVASDVRAAPTTKPAVAPEIIDALKGLKGATEKARAGTYDLIADKGDAQVIPALKAYRDGSLQLRNDRLVIFGERVNVAGQGQMLPLLDAITGQPVIGDDKQPIYFAKIDLSAAIKAPPRGERPKISDLISTLSLLDPDPVARLQSIRDVGERTTRALMDPADEQHFMDDVKPVSAAIKTAIPKAPPEVAPAMTDAASAIDAALAETPKSLKEPVPSAASVLKVKVTLNKLSTLLGASAATSHPASAALTTTVAEGIKSAGHYQDRIDAQAKVVEEIKKYRGALAKQLTRESEKKFVTALNESIAEVDAVTADGTQQLDAIAALGSMQTSRAAILLRRITDAATHNGDKAVLDTARKSLASAESYQSRVRFVQNTFAGLSSASLLILLALGLSIIFGLMGVINMAHGEFMMLGAFTTFVVSEFFKNHLPGGAYDYYPIIAVPAAFLVSGVIGYLVEALVIRHLYGRPLDSLLATWGIGLIFIYVARRVWGDNLSVRPPSWMEGGFELMPDMVFPLNRVYIIVFCVICIALVYYLVNWTKLGLLLRATTQNRDMAAALGVATRRVDGLTFALGTGLAGLAGVVVPLYNKINPNIGQEYVVDSFLVVVTGGVGKLAGVIWAGLGLGFIGKYLEVLLSYFPMFASGSSVVGKVLLLLIIIAFLQRRPSGIFPPKGRLADA